MLHRRDILKLAALLTDIACPWPVAAAARPKRVIVAGAGLAGLSCAWELSKRGHDVVVLEASNRTGGHVLTIREGLADGLYADGGAEHFTRPGYELYRSYVKEFELPVLAYPHRENILQIVDGRMLSEQEAIAIKTFEASGYNQREIDYINKKNSRDLTEVYLGRYIEKIRDEYQPFGVGLDALDDCSITDLLRREGASAAAIRSIGSDDSALHGIWGEAIVRLRGLPSDPHELYRLKGGNQALPDAFTARLESRIRKNCPVTRIQYGDTGITVTCTEAGAIRKFQGDYLVCSMNAIILRQIPVDPPWPDAKRFVIENMPYTLETRPIFQSRTKFWERDGYSGNMEFASPILGPLWPMAEDVATNRGLLIGTGQASSPADAAFRVFKRYYPGKSADIDHIMTIDWSLDKWAMGCQASDYRPGQLRKFWPASIQPVGRVYFAGAYCDNLNWGMEAATRSAYRVARAIHDA
jgi:monoamine oxidase